MKRRKPVQLERAEGRALITLTAGRWWAPMMHHSPNEEMNPIARQIAAGQGTRPGFPDYVLFLRIGDCPGFAFELKAPKPWGRPPTPNQQAWLDWFEAEGWTVGTFYGAELAVRALDEYARDARRPPIGRAVG